MNARGSEICDKFWKGMGLCCHIFFFVLTWYMLANLDDVLSSEDFEDDFGNYSSDGMQSQKLCKYGLVV